MDDRLAARPARAAAPGGSGPRVVFVEPRLYEDGGARATIRLVRELRRARVPVTLLALQRAHPDNAAPVPPGFEITYPTRRHLRLRQALPWAVLKLVPLARRSDVVVASREVGWGLLVGRVGSWLARRPFVAVVQAEPGAAVEAWVAPRLHRLTRLSWRTADRVVCIAPALVPAVVAQGVRPERATVVLTGVEVPEILEAGGRPAPALPVGEGPMLVGIGRLEAQKGFDVLLRAHARVLAAGHLHRLLILGEGSDRAELERLAAELGVTASVHMPGFSPDVLAVLATADLYVLSSRYEGLPTSLIEALVLGVPSVATDCVSGPRLLLADGAHGDLVPVEDVDALAAAIQRHLQEPQRLRAAAQRGRTWAVEHLSVERAARDFCDVLRDVAAQSRAGRAAA